MLAQRALAARPHDSTLLLGGASALERLGRQQEAQQHLSRALALRPRSPAALAAQRRLWAARGRRAGGGSEGRGQRGEL